MSTNGDRARTLCLGEALVDLICERPIDDLAQADAFSPHLGGVVANVAVTAARRGAAVSLAGGAGDDGWGRWLRDRLRDEGVDVSRFSLIDGSQTPLAVAGVDADGEPTYEVYGQPLPTVVAALGDDVADVVVESAALFVSSNTLVGAEERSVTMRARPGGPRSRATRGRRREPAASPLGLARGRRGRARTRVCRRRCWCGPTRRRRR